VRQHEQRDAVDAGLFHSRKHGPVGHATECVDNRPGRKREHDDTTWQHIQQHVQHAVGSVDSGQPRQHDAVDRNDGDGRGAIDKRRQLDDAG
jgi:hypothetical protein